MIYKNPNAYQEIVSSDPRNQIETIVGDDKQTPFMPQVKLMRWSNEHNLSIRLGGLPHDNRNLIRDYAGMIEYGDEKKKMRTYKKQYNNEDAWEFEWIYYTRPKTDTEKLTLQIKNLEFSKQPPLNEEITPGEGETVTATHHYDADGNILAHRAEDVVGSYAVYLSRGKSWNRQSPNMAIWYKLIDEYNSRDAGNDPSPSFAHLDTVSKLSAEISKYEALSTPELPYNKTYMTGKFCHIPRPTLIDANGNKAYADIDINRETALMTITYPKTFLDNAQYPVTVDPTFGYTSIGASSGVHTGYIMGIPATISENGTLDKLTAYIKGGVARGSVHKTSDDSLVDYSAEVDPDSSTEAWVDMSSLNVGASLVSGTEYYLGIWHGTSGITKYWDSGSPGFYDSMTYHATNAPDDPLNPTSWADHLISIYATYTAGGGGSSFTPRNNTLI